MPTPKKHTLNIKVKVTVNMLPLTFYTLIHRMQITDWNTRWQQNQIGFHENQPNRYLTKHFQQFKLNKKATVFIPLCGKSHDLFWLAQQGYHVVGIECSPIAVNDFFNRHQLIATTQKIKNFTIYQHQNIRIYQGDFFKLNPTHLTHCDLIIDRASLIAFPAHQRTHYTTHLKTWFGNTTQLLLITLSYKQNIMNGPPFSVPHEEVNQHYADKHIHILEQQNIVDEGPKWRKAGLNSLIETAFRIY